MAYNGRVRLDHTVDQLVDKIYMLFTDGMHCKYDQVANIGGLGNRYYSVKCKRGNKTTLKQRYTFISEAAYDWYKNHAPECIDEEKHLVEFAYGRFYKIDKNGMPKQAFVCEHIIPIECVYKHCVKLFKECRLTKHFIRSVLLENLHIAIITKDEDILLSKSGYKNKMPDGFNLDTATDFGLCRYDAVGIKMHNW